MTHLVVTPHPLTLEGRTITEVVQLIPGESLADFLGRAGVDLSQQDWVVSIGGAVVPALMWPRTRPKHGQIIECRRVAGRDVFRAIAFAVLAYYTFGAGAGWAAGGGLGTFLAQTAVFMIGSAVINKVLPPQRARPATYDQSTGSTYSLAGGRNRMRHYEPLGLLFGTTKVVPDYAAQPYSFFEADDQFLSMRFSGGLNVGAIGTLKIGDTPIESYEDVFQMRDGFPSGNTINIDWNNVDSVDGAVLEAPTVAPGAWVTRTTSPGTRRRSLDFVAQLYDMADNGTMNLLSVSVDVEERLLPSGTFAAVGVYTFTSGSTRPVRRTVTLPDPGAAGQFEIRVRKREVDVATGRKSNALEWQSLKSYQVESAPLAGYPQYGLRIRASGQLNGTVDQLSWVGSQRATQVWNGSAFVDQVTSNPGAQILQFARGLYDGDGRLQAGMGLPDDQIDIDQLKAFTLHCAANGYEFDHWFDAPLSCQDLMDSIAAVGLGSISDHTGKLGVVWAAPGQPIEAVVNMGNISAGTFSVEYVTREVAEELEVSWFDRASGYKPRSLRILAPGVTVPRETARLSPAGVVTEAAAVRVARWTMGQNISGRKSVTWEMDLEHLAFRRYSIIALSHDLTQWGYGGRVRSAVSPGGVVTLELDDEVPAGATRYIGLRIPGEKGYRVFSVATFSGTAHSVTLVGAWPGGVPFPGDSAANPPEDTLWIYDFKAEPGQRMRVVDIAPTEDMKGARIVAVPEPDALWTYMASGAYTASPAPAAAEPLVASNVVVTQRRLDLNVTNDAELWIAFDVTGPFNSAQIWGAPQGEVLQLLGQTVVPRFGPVLVGNDGIFVLEVRPFDQLGRPGTSVSVDYDVTLGTIVAGTSAQLVRLAATAQLFTFNAAGAAAPSSQTITLTAQLINLTGTATFVATLYDASNASLGTVTLGGSGNVRNMTEAQFGVAHHAIVVATLGALSDQITLSRVQDGAGGTGVDGLTVAIDNESHTVPASSAGVVSSYAGSGAQIVAFEGGAALAASASAVVSAFRIGTITQAPASSLTIGAVSYAVNTATIAVHSAMGSGVDAVVLTIPVTVYRADGSSVVINKKQTITKSKQGATGDPGANATLLALLATAGVFTFNSSGAAAPSGQTITLTAQLSNVSGTATFVCTRYDAADASLGTVTLGGSGNVRTLTAAQFGVAAYAVISATLGALSDQVTVSRVQDGAGGAGGTNGLTVVLDNEAHTVPASSAGVVSSYAGSGAQLEAFEGGSALAASASAVVSAFRIGTITQVPASTLTIGGVSYSGNVATMAVHSAMADGVDSVLLTIPVTVYRADGSSVVINKKQTITKSKQGAAGDPGAPATLLTLQKTADVFTFDTFGAASPSSQTISFTATLANVSGTATFVATRYDLSNTSLGTVTLGGSGNTRSMTAAQFGSAAYAVVEATLGALSDTVTVNRQVSGPPAEGPVSPGYIEVSHDEVFPDVAGAIVQFRRDGTVHTAQGPITGASYSLFGNWYEGGSSTVGDDYDVRVDVVNRQGDLLGTYNTWLQLNTSWTFAVEETVSAVHSDLLFNYYIRRRSDGLTMVVGSGYLWARSAA